MGGRPVDVVLVTGFESFAASTVNPSAMLVHQLDESSIAQARVIGIELPVSYRAAPKALREAVNTVQPSIVLSLGLASGRSMLALERVAINVLDYPIPDNEGAQPIEGPIVADGAAAYFATLPIKAIVAAWAEESIPGYISNTAGTYLCNQILYESLHLAAARGHRAGFIHLPYLPEQAARVGNNAPSMALNLMLQGVRRAIEVSVSRTVDIRLATGAVC